MNVILADRQDITRAGLAYILSSLGLSTWKVVADRTALSRELSANPSAIVILDYTTFDFSNVEELLHFCEIFPMAFLIIFSEDLSPAFIKTMMTASNNISVVSKLASKAEIQDAITSAAKRHTYFCRQTLEQLHAAQHAVEEQQTLTKTEREVLRDIAMGMTTREIAERRFSSFHTVNTHRRNIFRKIGVNNVHEATRYALRAGLIDAAEYYI